MLLLYIIQQARSSKETKLFYTLYLGITNANFPGFILKEAELTQAITCHRYILNPANIIMHADGLVSYT